MRILMISDVYFPRINGVSTSIQTFRRGLHAAGHETVLIAPQYPAGDAAQEGQIIRVPSRYLPRDPEDRIMKAGALRALRPDLKKSGFDLVHIQTPFLAHYHGVSIARELGVPVIETYHTYFEEYLHHYVPLIPRSVMRFVARRFTVSQCSALDSLVVPSRAMQAALEDYGVRCPMHIIPTGMEMERFASGNGRRFRERLGIAPDRPTLVHVGRIAQAQIGLVAADEIGRDHALHIAHHIIVEHAVEHPRHHRLRRVRRDQRRRAGVVDREVLDDAGRLDHHRLAVDQHRDVPAGVRLAGELLAQRAIGFHLRELKLRAVGVERDQRLPGVGRERVAVELERHHVPASIRRWRSTSRSLVPGIGGCGG